MARIIFPNNEQITDSEQINEILAAINVTLRQWPLPQSTDVEEILEKPSLSDEEKEQLLALLDHRFETLKQEHGYTTRDLIVLHENIPGLDEMLAKFVDIHYHADDEVRYIVAGKGYFGFVDNNEQQFMLEVIAGDYINVPANAEHWFTLGDSKRIKAVRYFIDTEGWTPVYTHRASQFNTGPIPA